MAKIFVGVSWPYANGPLHVGHVASSYLPPDIFARYHRMKGDEVLMVSGSDMHGTPTTVIAEKEGVPPEVIARRYHDMNSRCMEDLGIAFDLFFNTAHENHKRVVREIFLALHGKGHMYDRMMLLPFCPSCERFLPDRYVKGECPHCEFPDARGDQCDECGKTLDPEELKDLTCRLCGKAPEMRESRHLFFRLSAFQEKLADYVKDKTHWKANTIKFTRHWLESGLKDRPVTRDIAWGIDVPLDGYEGKKIYVWFEAVMGYMSAAREVSRLKGDEGLWERFWKDPDCRHYYFIGKDNIPFHTIIWPAMLMGLGGYNLPYDVPANEHMRLGKERFSKSRGVLVEIPTLLERYDPDAVRYYITMILPEHRDAEFSWDEFFRKNNDELVATYGNFVNRVLTFTDRNFGAVPEPSELDEVDEEFVIETDRMVREVAKCIERCAFQSAMKNLMHIATLGNRYIDERAPWSLLKEDKKKCATAMNTALQAVKKMAVASAPFLPFSAARLWKMLGLEGGVHAQRWDEAFSPLPQDQKLVGVRPLFEKLAPEGPKESPEELAERAPIFLRLGEVLEVRDHPNADKLYLVDISFGDETRTLVAGLKKHYAPGELKGKRIVVVCNLQPAKIRGVESRGMLLAGQDEKGVGVLFSDAGQPGDVIMGGRDAPELPFSEFQKLKLEVIGPEGPGGRAGAMFVHEGSGIVLKAGGKRIIVDKDVKPGSSIG